VQRYQCRDALTGRDVLQGAHWLELYEPDSTPTNQVAEDPLRGGHLPSRLGPHLETGGHTIVLYTKLVKNVEVLADPAEYFVLFVRESPLYVEPAGSRGRARLSVGLRHVPTQAEERDSACCQNGHDHAP